MSAADIFVGPVNEDGDFSIIGRVTAFDGTGAASPLEEEGNLVKQADLTSIQVKIYNTQSETPTTAEQTANPTVASVIFDTLQTTGIWKLIRGGGNFKYDVAASWVPAGRTAYRIEVKFTTTGSKVYWGKWQAETQEILGA